ANVRRNQEVRTLPEGMLQRQRLRIGDVNRSTNPARVERVNQCISIHNRPTRSIYKECALLHQFKLASADKVTRLSSRRQNEHDNLRLRNELIEFVDCVNLRIVPCSACDSRYLDSKWRKHPLDLFADSA